MLLLGALLAFGAVGLAVFAVGAIVWIVRVNVAAVALVTDTLGGLKVHVASAGRPEQSALEKLKVPVKPLTGVMVKLTVPFWPCVMLKLLTSGTKSKFGAWVLCARAKALIEPSPVT